MKKIASAFSAAKEIPRGEAQQKQVTALCAKIDRTIKQPPKIDQPGEVTLSSIDLKVGEMKDRLDGMGDLSQEQAIKMQMAQSRYQKMMELLSNVMKSIGDTSGQIIGNMK